MFVLFEEAGKFQAGRVMQEAEASLQVELESGKRVKLKAVQALLRFDKPAPAVLLSQAQGLATEIDLDLAWECAPEGDFSFKDLAADYFSASAAAPQQAAALLRLFEAPHYFRRLGKGLFKKAPQETVKAALAGIERKKQIAAQIDAWAAELVAGQCPQPVREQLYRILFKPDKQAPEYRAVVQAAKSAQLAPLALLQGAGAISSAYQFHWQRFLFEAFAQGIGFGKDAKALAPAPLKEELPVAEAVQAFSIDDSSTTEIDDALSVQGLGTGTVTLGIHIAAPALGIAPGSALDKIARDRLSTVYMPGWKITMLPDELVQQYTLAEGRACPALSLYLTLDEQTLEITARQTKLERVPIAANLRHDQLDQALNAQTLAQDSAPADLASDAAPFFPQLRFLWRLAQHLKALREQARGKPETFNRPDYNFKLERETDTGSALPDSHSDSLSGSLAGAPTGDETVHISTRQRGAPLDLIVAEAMILANCTWGGWLAQLGVPAIYRSQASMAPGIKVRMGIKPLPHAGMGVPQYAWSTSPLRRMVDLANQWQLIACVRHGPTAALAAPFKPKDAALFALISAFDAAYTGYNDFQNGIERFWTLRWLQQNGVQELETSVIKPGAYAVMRADSLPLVFELAGAGDLPRGARVKVRVVGVDLLTLELKASLLARLDAAQSDAQPAAEDEEDEASLGAAAGGLQLAISLDEAGAEEGAAQGKLASSAIPAVEQGAGQALS